MLKIIREACIWFVVTLFACVLVLVIMRYAQANEVPNFGIWDKVGICESEFETTVVLKNPKQGNVVFVIIRLNYNYTVTSYILVNSMLKRYQFNGDEFVYWELDEEAQRKIWLFLISIGIISI